MKQFPAATARSFSGILSFLRKRPIRRCSGLPEAWSKGRGSRLLCLAAVAALLLCAAAVAAPAAAGTSAGAVPAAPPATERDGTSFLDSPDLAEAPSSALPTVGVTLARLLGAMLLIVAVLVGGGLLFKRFAKRALNFSRGTDSPLRVVERLALGPKNQVCLIQACGHYLVIGVTEKEINVLMEVTLPGEEDAPGEFAAMLGSAVAPRSSQADEKLRGRRQN